MSVSIDIDAFRPLVELVVQTTLNAVRDAESQLPIGRLAFNEEEAANLLGVAKHVLREARYDGKVSGSRVGRGVVYQRDELLAFLTRQRIQNGAAQ